MIIPMDIKEKCQAQIIELQPDDKILMLFNPEYVDLENARLMYETLKEEFPDRALIGLYGTDIKIIKENENAEDNFKKLLVALKENS